MKILLKNTLRALFAWSGSYQNWIVPCSLYSPSTTRPPSPKSDTEVDRQKNAEVDQSILTEEDNTLWEWGDLPRKSISSDTPIAFPDNTQGKMGTGGTCK